MPERYSKRRAPNDRPLGWDPKFALSRCHAEMHNRMLNTRWWARSVSLSEISSYRIEPCLVVEHTRYNPSRSRRQFKQPAAILTNRKDPPGIRLSRRTQEVPRGRLQNCACAKCFCADSYEKRRESKQQPIQHFVTVI